MTELVLCYVREPWLYFTSQPLDQQWGDDWDDAPYEHNAGDPYGDEGVAIVRVAYEGLDAVAPCSRCGVGVNSPWSVQDINNRVVPWLATWWEGEPIAWAGQTARAVIDAIEARGGTVYLRDGKLDVLPISEQVRMML